MPSLFRGTVPLLAFLAISSSASAQVAPPLLANPANGARMLDARVNDKGAFVKAVSARVATTKAGLAEAERQSSAIAAKVTALKRTMPGLEVQYSGFTGAPALVHNERGSLTAAAPGQGSEGIVRGFLDENGALYGLSASDLADLTVLGDSPGGTSGLRMLRMEQRIDGRPVFQSETRFLLDRDGRLMESLGQMVPNARALAPQIDAKRLLSPGDAVARLLGRWGKSASGATFKVLGEHDGWTELSNDGDFVKGRISARQVLFPLAPGTLVPAWSLVVFTTSDQDWYAIVDAETGEVLWRKNIRASASAHDARFRVYVQADGVTPADSPAPQSPNTVAPGAGTQFPGIAPTIVSMHTAYDPAASPNGWIDDCPAGGCTANETQTLGNNTLTCLDQVQTGGNADLCDTAAAGVIDGNGRATGNPDANGRNRDFLGTTPRDFQTGFIPPPQAGNPEAGQTCTGNGTSGTAAIDQFRRGLMTHLFYTTNWYHDQLYKLGFDEASGNFQQTNFSGMGLGGDRVLGDADDGSGTANANFATPPDGVSGRMQMYRFTGPTIDRDGGLDAEISMHEMTHGTSNRLVGNGAGLNWDASAGMGEGWSDYVALSLLNNTNADDPNGRYASGAYATYKLAAGYLDNYVYGIRRFPYSTDNTVNPMTWADVDDVTNSLTGGIAADPLGFNLNGGMEVHNIGEIWALTLWEVRSRIIADPAGANGDVPTGNHTALQLVIDGLKLTPIDPTFTDARDAILNADCATHACANEASIWGGFSDRGLGYGAFMPFKYVFGYIGAHVGLRESFKLPFLDIKTPATDVTVDDSATNNNGVVDPGETVKISVKLTNPWRAASKAVAGAVATLTTSTPGVTIYDNTSTYGAIAPQGSATGDTFMVSVDPSVGCGSALDFTVTTVSSLGTTSTTFSLRVGAPSGTDPVVTYTGTPSPALTITNQRPRGVFHQINVADDFVISDLDFRLNSVTMVRTGDLTAILRSPGAIGNDLVGLIGGVVAGGGTGANVTNMVIDDDVPFTVANDMVQAANAAAPFTKSWLPAFNAPWPPGAGFPTGPDPVGNLSRFDGTSTKGTWTALVSDQGQFAAGGTFNGWSMLVTPVHFACSAVTSTVVLAATKTVSGTFTVGGTVTYTITLTNSGTGNQADNTGHELTDTLPASLTLISATATSGTATTAGNTANWDGTLAPLGGSVTITITATINTGTQGTSVSNQGTATYDADVNGTNEATQLTDDPGVGGTTDPTLFNVGGASLTATKTVSGTFTVGGTVTYTVVLSNSGNTATPNNAGNELTDTLPASLTLVSASATGGTAGSAGNTATWNGSIPAAGSVTITITATINAGAQGTTISNQGSASYDADLNGSNETTIQTDDPGVAGTANPTSFTVGIATLAATKTVAGTFHVGGTVTYTIVLSNSGTSASPDNAGNEFTDTLPASLTLVSATATGGTASTAANTANWNGSVPAGGSVTITLTATVNAGAQGTTISNQGSVSYDGDLNGSNETTLLTDDPAVGGASDPTSFTVGSATVAATKTVSGTFTVGGTITYTVVLSNSGNTATPDNAGNEFTDTLPASLTLVSASATGGTASTAGNVASWNGAIPAAGSVTITITATINAGTQGTTISNQGSVSYDADLNGSNETTLPTDDPAVAGAADPTSFTVGAAALSASKSVSGTFNVGDTVTYTIVISNSGASASTDNPGHELTDTLPAALTLVSASATSGAATTAGNTVNWDGGVPAGGSVTITITATIGAGAAGQTVSNQASVSYDADLDGTNETTGMTDDPAAGGSADPTSFVVGGGVPEPIPTLSECGLALLGLALLLAGWSTLRRRKLETPAP